MVNVYQQNPTSHSLKGRDLAGANFRDCNIRGIDFTNAYLVGADFSNAEAGLPMLWLAIHCLGLALLAGLAGLIIGYAAAFPALISNILTESNLWGELILLVVGLLVIATFGVLILWRGIGAALGGLAVAVATYTGIIAFAGNADSDIVAAALIQAIGIAISVAGVLLAALAMTIARLLANFIGYISASTLAVIGIIVGVLEGSGFLDGLVSLSSHSLLLLGSGLLAAMLVALSIFVGARATSRKYWLIYRLAITIATLGSTRFYNANLQDASFTETSLKLTDFRRANLTRTRWQRAKSLKQCRLERTYLENEDLRHLVVTQNGENLNFDRCSLRGLNLAGANLTNISLIGADLSESNLQGANLSQAKLAQAQLYDTDLREACLTGAFIQDWAIATDTRFDQVRCDYIYMRLPTPDNPEVWRKPDNRHEVFQANDFADFIAPIIKTLDLYKQQNLDPRKVAATFKTLDLYHYEGIDPSAAAIALKQLAEQYPEAELEVVALEGRGREKVRLQAVVAEEVNPSQLNAAYFEKYQELAALPFSDIQALLAGIEEKDARIRSLEQMVTNAIQGQKYYVETYYNMGDTVAEKDSSIHIQAEGSVSGVVGSDASGTVNLGTISGNVSNLINQLPDTLKNDESSLKELLTQLQTAIENEPELPPEDKAEALEQVETLAQAGQNSPDGTLKKAGKTAMKILKGTTAGLSETSNLVQECAKLLPAISALLLLI